MVVFHALALVLFCFVLFCFVLCCVRYILRVLQGQCCCLLEVCFKGRKRAAELFSPEGAVLWGVKAGLVVDLAPLSVALMCW